MLDSTYSMYLELADNVPDWRTVDKNKLINDYCDLVDSKSYKAEYYLAAIICRYWPKINRVYTNTQFSCTPEDVYDWLVSSIIGATEGRSWRDPTKPIYNDPQGPDKIINRIMKTERINHLVHVNRYKRKINLGIASIDEFQENIGDAVEYAEDEPLVEDMFDDIDRNNLMEYIFNKKLYFLFFVYDIIISNSCSDGKGAFSESAVVKEIKQIDNQYLSDLSEKCGIPYKDILFAYSVSVAGRSSEYLHEGVRQAIRKLRQLYFQGDL